MHIYQQLENLSFIMCKERIKRVCSVHIFLQISPCIILDNQSQTDLFSFCQKINNLGWKKKLPITFKLHKQFSLNMKFLTVQTVKFNLFISPKLCHADNFKGACCQHLETLRRKKKLLQIITFIILQCKFQNCNFTLT